MRLFPDIDEETERKMIEEVRNMSDAQKLRQIFERIEGERQK